MIRRRTVHQIMGRRRMGSRRQRSTAWWRDHVWIAVHLELEKYLAIEYMYSFIWNKRENNWCILQKLRWVQNFFLSFLPQNDRLLS